jgi:hypothetical protein
MTRRTWFSSVCNTRAISGAVDLASDTNTIWARWRNANTFDWRNIRRSRCASSGNRSRTNTDAGRPMTWTRVTGAYFSAALLATHVVRWCHVALDQ